ncbi:hypothetical protein [Furfurilactobacillus entadae]|uniref:hypothetical protein n=1 Tax=Furfurilactobacillus entadae TaxID=2922307 RepID=UPI0035E68CB0
MTKISIETKIIAVEKWKQQNHASITATCGHFGFASVEATVRWERLYNLYGSQVLLEM